MNFIKKIFGNKESDSEKLKQNMVPEYTDLQANLKVMTELNIFTEAVLAAEEIYTNKVTKYIMYKILQLNYLSYN